MPCTATLGINERSWACKSRYASLHNLFGHVESIQHTTNVVSYGGSI